MPLRYLWVFFAYMAIKKASDRFSAAYHFVTNPALGFFAGLWCFAFTAFACIMGMFPKDVAPYTAPWYFQFAMTICTPIVLLGIGLILPALAKKEKLVK